MKRKMFTPAKALLLAILVIPMLGYAALGIKGKGEMIKENRYEDGFSGIELAIDATVFITIAPEYSIEIKAQQNVLDVIESRVKGSNLIIAYLKNVSTHDGITIHITAPEFDMLMVRGNGIIKCTEPIVYSDLNLLIDGDGLISLNAVQSKNLMANIVGNGSMEIKGNTDLAVLRIDGKGVINSVNFNAKKADIAIKGAGLATIKVWNNLDVKIVGNGKVEYDGDPILNQQLSGSAILAKR